MLDNTAVVWLSEVAKGNDHTHRNMPFMIAGRCGGAFRTGRFLHYPSRHFHNELLVSLLNAMGGAAQTFGNPDFCPGPLPGLG